MVEEWQIATLAEKFPPQILKQGSQLIAKVLSEKANGLEVESDFGQQGQWLQVKARGKDADAFLNLLRQELGEAPLSRANLEKWDVVRGFIAGAGRIGYGVYVDIGIQDPRPKDALYPLHRMRAQLADGEPRSAREILDANALVDCVPLKMIVTELEGENISVELDDQARDNLVSWRKYPFDRVIVVGADRAFVENAVRASGLESDVVKVESLSLFVQSVLCKIGTEAPGVIAKIGNRLRGVGLKSYRTPVKL
ncbi:DUF2110 family protein [Candidatus Bathyarchaeota archaeon]|nr:MAG: DUF2110 family protein [Candidatus Bathyarchaeota archaeon]TMI60119.1 MAG: DUF2110 family protein [Candidatus Bathyarchaeota archaeon]